MIWVAGEIVPDDALKISVLDRTFEHGLGLFETFRTWNGNPTLLDRHLSRLKRSADVFEIRLDATSLPDLPDIVKLTVASGYQTADLRFRLTVSGGVSGEESAIVWMSAHTLPATRLKLNLGTLWEVSRFDAVSRHKCLNYWNRRSAFEWAESQGFDDALILTSDKKIWETSRSNLFAVIDDVLVTPPTSGPLLPGIMRSLVLERAQSLQIQAIEKELSCDDIQKSSEALLTNAVRGIQPIETFPHPDLGYHSFPKVPGPITKLLWDDILPWLNRGGIDP